MFLLLALQVGSVWGATYNFNFNNVEQGENGHASPTVVVRDGKYAQVTPPAVIPPAAETEAPPAAPAVAPVTEASSAAPVSITTVAPRKRRSSWSAEILGSALMPLETDLSYSPLVLGAMSWNMVGPLTVRVMAGNMFAIRGSLMRPRLALGAEVEFSPIRVPLWGQEDGLIMGALVGANNFVNRTESRSMYSSPLYAGFRTQVNFLGWLGLAAQTRLNFDYITAEGALVFRI